MTPSEAPVVVTPETAVSVQDVSKSYRLYDRPSHRLLEALTRGRQQRHRLFWALRDVSFDVPTGTTMGIIGRNGSGKSTILQIIAGTLAPTQGQVVVRGRTSALLELGSGFNGDFTGRENVFLNAAVMGLGHDEIADRYESIERFADIGEFIDQPVKTYSSGMLVRLAFAVAVHVDPDVLIVDEALAVGDILFQHKCIARLKAFIRSGKTVLFVSHDPSTIKMLCDQAVLLDHGRVVDMGDAERIARVYHRLLFDTDAASQRPVEAAAAPQTIRPRLVRATPADDLACTFRRSPEFLERTATTRFGDGRARIVNVELHNLDGEPIYYVEFDQEVLLDIHIEFHEAVESVIVGYLFRNQNGLDVIGTNTYAEGVPVTGLAAGDRIVVRSRLRLPLHPGGYTVSPAVMDERNLARADYFDWVDNAIALEVMKPSDRIVYAMFHVDQRLRVERA
jgi:ABC-type polysaccharide/polyol phosphate transport system ATPase subunit